MLERLKAGGEGMTEEQMVGWHHWTSWLSLSKLRGDGEEQRSSEEVQHC